MATVQELAQEMLDNMTVGTRKDGTEYVHTKKTIPWQRDIIYEAHQDRMPNDIVYGFIHDALILITEYPDASEDELREAIYDIEPDVYTSDLTNWLGDHNENMYYLDQVLQEYQPTDGFQALSMAQAMHRQEVASIVLDELMKKMD